MLVFFIHSYVLLRNLDARPHLTETKHALFAGLHQARVFFNVAPEDRRIERLRADIDKLSDRIQTAGHVGGRQAFLATLAAETSARVGPGLLALRSSQRCMQVHGSLWQLLSPDVQQFYERAGERMEHDKTFATQRIIQIKLAKLADLESRRDEYNLRRVGLPYVGAHCFSQDDLEELGRIFKSVDSSYSAINDYRKQQESGS